VSAFCFDFCENAANEINIAAKQIIRDFILYDFMFERNSSTGKKDFTF
jgi:hypothetical protein